MTDGLASGTRIAESGRERPTLLPDEVANISHSNSLLWWLAVASIVTFVVSMALIPWIVVRLPSDYFVMPKRRYAMPKNATGRFLHFGLLVLKNVLGAIFLTLGVGMLVLPGQGLLTILIGLSLVDFPGKYRLERYLVTRSPVLRSLNWLRRRTGKPPFRVVG